MASSHVELHVETSPDSAEIFSKSCNELLLSKDGLQRLESIAILVRQLPKTRVLACGLLTELHMHSLARVIIHAGNRIDRLAIKSAIEPIAVHILRDALIHANCKIQTLRMQACELGDAGLERLAEVLEFPGNHLTDFKLVECAEITQLGLKRFALAMTSRHNVLKTLSMQETIDDDDEGALTMAETMAHESCTLDELSLECPFHDPAVLVSLLHGCFIRNAYFQLDVDGLQDTRRVFCSVVTDFNMSHDLRQVLATLLSVPLFPRLYQHSTPFGIIRDPSLIRQVATCLHGYNPSVTSEDRRKALRVRVQAERAREALDAAAVDDDD